MIASEKQLQVKKYHHIAVQAMFLFMLGFAKGDLWLNFVWRQKCLPHSPASAFKIANYKIDKDYNNKQNEQYFYKRIP